MLDKTGTITEGKPKVTDIYTTTKKQELLKISGSLEKNSEHPLAEAIVEKAKDEKIELSDVKEFLAVSGRGIKGTIEEKTYYGGNIAFMKENKIDTNKAEEQSEKYLNEGKTVLYFADEKEIIGIIAMQDKIKDTSIKAIEELKKQKIEIAMITGDNKLVAEQIGNKIGIDKIIAEVLPQDKEREVTNLQEQGKNVAFVGDGINDSPALAKADVGIAIGSGTDIAIESADIVLMKNSLLDVSSAIALSKAVIRNIKLNLFWAFFYNVIGIPVACGIFYTSIGLKLNPMIGALAMSLSSVCVVTNALRLRNFKTKFERKEESKMEEFVKEIHIEGMHCNHCKMTVEKVLSAIDGITNVEVSLEDKKAIIKSNKEIEENKIKTAIEEEGFEVK